MSKLLINAPSGRQEIIEVGEGGGYFDLTRVLWDERVDGPMPEITLGGMARSGSTLSFNQVQMDAYSQGELDAGKQAQRDAIQATIDDLERTTLLNRGSREMAIWQLDDKAAEVSTATGIPKEQILAANVFYGKLMTMNAQFIALRAELTAI